MASSSGSSSWQIVESGFQPELLRHYEGAFTLGGPGLHIRGSLEEHLADAPQNESYWRLPGNVTSEAFRKKVSEWGTFVPGVYGRHPLLNNQLINLPCFLEIAPVVDGERLDLSTSEILSHERILDMGAACLTRRTVWRTRSGAQVTVEMDRFVSAVRPRLCVQRLTLTADRDIDLAIHAGIDADVRTNGFDHFTSVGLSCDVGGRPALACDVQTDSGDRVRIRCDTMLTPDAGARWSESRSGDRRTALVAAMRLSAGEPMAFEKRTAVSVSGDGDAPQDTDAAEATLAAAADLTWQQLLDEHRAAWAARWGEADVEIDGDVESQRATRFSIYHLLRCWPGPEGRLAIDAKGYAGQAYWGRFFWDSEIYLLPFYGHTVGGSFLTRYRVDTLPGARRNAARYKASGAKYAWEADARGDECCPNWQYADHEIHISADVVYALLHEARLRGGDVNDAAAGTIVEIGRYWLSRLTWDERGRAHILAVMGPDEYTFLKDDNAFTNRLAAFSLEAAASFGNRGSASPEEIASFEHAAAAIVTPRDENGDILQCAGFDDLGDPEFDRRWKDRSRTFAAQVPQEWLYRTKCLKQADLLMLPFLFEQEWTDEQVHRAWDRYVPWTTHDSSLSAGVHGILACRLARTGVPGMGEQAWRFWRHSRDIDVLPEQRGCEQGIHIANAAALWQVIVFGFAGLGGAMWREELTLRPCLPLAWQGLRFPLRWRGSSVRVEVLRASDRPGQHIVRLEHTRGEEPLPVSIGAQSRALAVGESAEFIA